MTTTDSTEVTYVDAWIDALTEMLDGDDEAARLWNNGLRHDRWDKVVQDALDDLRATVNDRASQLIADALTTPERSVTVLLVAPHEVAERIRLSGSDTERIPDDDATLAAVEHALSRLWDDPMVEAAHERFTQAVGDWMEAAAPAEEDE